MFPEVAHLISTPLLHFLGETFWALHGNQKRKAESITCFGLRTATSHSFSVVGNTKLVWFSSLYTHKVWMTTALITKEKAQVRTEVFNLLVAFSSSVFEKHEANPCPWQWGRLKLCSSTQQTYWFRLTFRLGLVDKHWKLLFHMGVHIDIVFCGARLWYGCCISPFASFRLVSVWLTWVNEHSLRWFPAHSVLLGQSEQANMALGGLFGWPGTSCDHWELAVEMCCGLTQERNESNGLQLLLSGRWLAS